MLRDVERVIDHQVAAIEQLDAKTGQALALGLSGFPLLVLLATAGVPRVGILALLVAAGSANAVAVLWLLRAHHASGTTADVTVGPAPAWVAEVAREERTLQEYLASVLDGYARYAAANARFMAEMKARREGGVALLLVAALLYGAAALAMVLANIFS